jgi:hypothetical protein
MKNDWVKKATCSAYLSSKVFATSAWACTRSASFSSFRSVFANNSVLNLHFMKVSTENDNNFGYEKITILVDNIPLKFIYSTVTVTNCTNTDRKNNNLLPKEHNIKDRKYDVGNLGPSLGCGLFTENNKRKVNISFRATREILFKQPRHMCVHILS